MKKIVLLVLALAMVLALGACASSSSANNWPERPITVLVPANVGGDTDTTIRTLSAEIGSQIDGVIALSNMSGGAGAVATYELLDYEPDGYTAIWHHYDSILLTMKGTMDQRYDEYLDIAAVVPVVGGESTILVNKESGFESFEELVSYAKAHPGELNWGVETGGFGHLFSLSVTEATDIDVKFVDIGSASERTAALLGGTVDIIAGKYEIATSYPDDLVCLAVGSAERKDYSPDVPTLTELGYDCFAEMFYYFGFRKGTDPAIVEKMGAAIAAAAKTDEAAEVFQKYYYSEWPVLTGQDAIGYLHDFEAKYESLVELMLQE